MSLAPGNNVSAGKRKYGRTGDAGTYIKPMLIQAAWAATQVRGRLQARYNRLVRRMGGPKNPAAKKKAIVAIAHTLLKIAYTVLKTGTGYQEPGADFYTRREAPGHRQARLERQIQKLHPGCTVTRPPIPPRRPPYHPAPDPPPAGPPAPRSCRQPRHPGLTAGQTSTRHQPRHRTGRGLLPRAPSGTQFSCQASAGKVLELGVPAAVFTGY